MEHADKAAKAPGPVLSKWIEYGCPLIAGGDDEAAEEFEGAQDEPTPDAAEAPEPEAQDEPQAETEPFEVEGFDREQLPEEVREYADALERQFKSAYTRKTQELARQRKEAETALAVYDALQDPERAPEILRALGYELDDEGGYEDAEGAQIDPYEELRGEIDSLRQTLSERDEYDLLAREVAGLEQDLGRKLTKDEMGLVARLALDDPLPDGTPDVKGAWATIDAIVATERQRWVSSKRAAPKPPSRSAAEADERVDRSNPEVRRQLMEEIVQRELESAS